MTQIGGPKHEPIDIGLEVDPPFAVAPDPDALFKRRSQRLHNLSAGHELEGYLQFVARLTALQADLVGIDPAPRLPDQKRLDEARAGAMPPLPTPGPDLVSDAAFVAILSRLTGNLTTEGNSWPPPASAAAQAVAGWSEAELAAAIDALRDGVVPQDRIAEHVLIAAALQVYFTRAAAALDAGTLQRVADGVCPACGAAPVASSVVGWAKAQNTRFCTCSLCATQWNVVRVKCVTCGETGKISYSAIDGRPDLVKAEVCGDCNSYVKILTSVKDPALEPLADDIATLALDLKLAELGVTRRAVNPFLMGYGRHSAEPTTPAKGPEAT